MFKGFLEHTAYTLTLAEVEVMTVNGNQVACLLRWKANTPDGKALDVKNIDVYTIRNGKIINAVIYSADPGAEDAFWGK
jgi:uncharacterized protein